MTTIATDGKSMAGDGLRMHHDTVTNRSAKKVRRLKDGSLVGTAGDAAFGYCVIEWLENGGDPPKLECDGGFSCLILKPTGELLLSGQDCRPLPIEPPFAVGSGMDIAIGAMRAGASPQKAVKIACDCDPGSGGEITTLHLEQLKAMA
jgi:ATP-dependent protease HslVU (ClpYQ) peptidase subunit